MLTVFAVHKSKLYKASKMESRHVEEILRKGLKEKFAEDDSLVSALGTYLSCKEVGEEDPILCVNYLDHFMTMAAGGGVPLPAARKATIVNALIAQGATDIMGLGIAFHFPTHGRLNIAKRNLGDAHFNGNVRWAYVPSPFALQYTNEVLAAVGIPAVVAPPPCLETVIISFFSHKPGPGQLACDAYYFFQ